MTSQHTSAKDPFHTAELRRRVLAAWTDSAARFREDANAEEDFALSGYRDRIVIELAQNAADAALRAGDAGRLLLALDGMYFTAANTGAPLTAEGVESLSTLRASSKRHAGASTGRFGVGFSAVSAVSDEIVVSSAGKAVQFSQRRARHAVEAVLSTNDALAREVESRDGHVPALRLPFPAAPQELPGYDTCITVTLRSEKERDRVRDLLQHTGEALLVALDGLSDVIIDIDGHERQLARRDDAGAADFVTSVDGVSTRWRAVRHSGTLVPELLEDRPREERQHTSWTVQWAVPVTAAGEVAPLPPDVEHVVYAPTASDTALQLPALLIGTFPLSSDRRAIQPGPASDFLTMKSAETYCELMNRLDGGAALALVPEVTLSGSAFEAALRRALDGAMQHTPFLRTHDGRKVTPQDAVVLDPGTGHAAPELADMLAPIVDGLLPGEWDPRAPALRALKVHRIGLADVADLLAGRDNEPSWWAKLYGAIRACADRGADLRELGALPVPLADGRLVQGVRSALIPPSGAGAFRPETLGVLGLRVVHPHASDALLERLGAKVASAHSMLTDPLTEAAVRSSLDADDPEAIAAAVLMLVSQSGLTTADLPWLSELALLDDEGEYTPAGELLIPGAPLESVILADDAPARVHDDVVAAYGTEVLKAVGALWDFTVRRVANVDLGPDLEKEFGGIIDGLGEWTEYALELLGDPPIPPMIPELTCVTDLDLVDDSKWSAAFALLANADVRAAVIDSARVLTAAGEAVDVPSYASWWLRTYARIGGKSVREYRTSDADAALIALYDEMPEPLDGLMARAVGVRRSLADLLADDGGPDELLERLADPARHVSWDALHAIWLALTEVDADRVSPPVRLRAVTGDEVVVADAEDVLILDRPDLYPLVAGQPLILVPAWHAPQLADVLDIGVASEEVAGVVASHGEEREVPEHVHAFLAGAPHRYIHHETLLVGGVKAEWSVAGGKAHASTVDGLARAVCWIAGQWQRRHLVAAVLREPSRVTQLRAEAEMD